MMQLPLIASAILVVVAMLGVWLDIQRVNVPGWASIAAVILGAGLNLFLFGVRGFVLAIAGVIVAAATYYALHLLRIADLGNLKLMAPVGAIVGPRNWLLICVISVLLGVPIAIFVGHSTAQLKQTGATKGLIVREFFQFLPPYHITDERRALLRHGLVMRHGSLVAIGILFFLAMTALWAGR